MTTYEQIGVVMLVWAALLGAGLAIGTIVVLAQEVWNWWRWWR